MIAEMVRQIVRLPKPAAASPIEYRGGVPESFALTWQV